jgi:phosphoribosylformimino-5-aminoimidazole carboxamide ribotide isomerase
MNIIPAVDIKDGRCVRLLQGKMDAETIFSDDPTSMARQWDRMGADLIHVVDLDGAITKRPQHIEIIKSIVDSVSAKVQVGGGIRNLETIDQYISSGIERVIIGTEAIRNPELVDAACQSFPDRIVVGIDARNGRVAIEGWTEDTEMDAIELAKRFEDSGVAVINFTDIHRDGMQTGPNIEETRRLAESVDIPVVASGGVSTLEDIRNLIPLEPVGVVGVITGKALYSGTLNFEEALRLVSQEKP